MSLQVNYLSVYEDQYARDRAHALDLISKKFKVHVWDLIAEDWVRFTELVSINGQPAAVIIDHMKVIRDRRGT